jgi:amidohydrolase
VGGDSLKRRAQTAVSDAAEVVVGLSRRIHAHPELAMEEEQAAMWCADALARSGFDVTPGYLDVPTAFAATAGDGPLHVLYCAEYDALPGVGHACGHNVIAASAVAAGIGLAAVAEDIGCRVTVLGTPAEEAVGGKAILAARGAFDGVDAALMVHPSPVDVAILPYLAVESLIVRVRGEAAHASLVTDRSGNALDATVEVHRMLSHSDFTEWERCHGIITNGGAVPNVVPEETEAYYYVRARTAEDLDRLRDRIVDQIETVVRQAGCTLELPATRDLRYREVKHNRPLARAYTANAELLGRTFLDQKYVSPAFAASTDMGNVSQLVPAIHPTIGIDSLPHMNHMRGFATAAAKPAADMAALQGGTALAWTGIDLAITDGMLDDVRADFAATDSTGEAADAK